MARALVTLLTGLNVVLLIADDGLKLARALQFDKISFFLRGRSKTLI